jgi:hypothetical protein
VGSARVTIDEKSWQIILVLAMRVLWMMPVSE